MNIWLPVFFYTRAFNGSDKNRQLEGTEEQMGLIKKAKQEGKELPDDGRYCVKVFAWITFVLGTIIGVWGIVYVILELQDAKEDEV